MTYKIINGLTAVKGYKDFTGYNNGKKLSPHKSISAFCYQCLGGYAGMEGERDCKTNSCPLYPYMPYNPNKTKKIFSEETEKKHRENLKNNLPNK